ncbi:hypothetical protein K9N68_28200 [Kovacikia minuta CCNUW1]|uniref:hypothetical protein n=1 Tax=Kovacikia minuta TaxID=2931930 RepID=UPI001CCA01B4|nr:hypothetical protein [Kovacikia minuta]UBF25437.1 hypothetical protein K9N68_28200 [Kovacikia minuta CCNUW1]
MPGLQTATTQPYQFVGYWGFGAALALEERLTHLVNQAAPSQAVPQQGGQSPLHASLTQPTWEWKVAYLGESTGKIAHPPGIIAAIAASGAGDSACSKGAAVDAWVKIEGDRLILGREPLWSRSPLLDSNGADHLVRLTVEFFAAPPRLPPHQHPGFIWL